jgi:hypothetical protein
MVVVDSDYFADHQDSVDISITGQDDDFILETSTYGTVLVKQCQLKRARFVF